MQKLTDAWLQQVNAEYRRNQVPAKQRPWLAWRQWIKHTGRSVELSDDVTKQIFDWFERHTTAGRQYVGPIYTGAFYYDSCFWPVIVPLVFGRVQVSAWDGLKTMPPLVMKQLWREQAEVKEYAVHWANCIDYAFGIDELLKRRGFSQFSHELLKSGGQQMKAIVSLLLDGDRPNSKAGEGAAMATEIFLKAFLSSKASLTEDEAKKKIGHNLEEALRRCAAVDPKSELLSIRPDLGVLPAINERYKGSEMPLGVLWRSYEIAQFIGTTVCQSLTGRDTRKTPSVRV